MNNIFTKQNENENLKLLCAARELYSSAKRVQVIQLILTIAVPISLSFLGMFFPDLKIWSVVAGIFIVILNMVFFERIIKYRREKAAKIQEMYDCEVLSMPLSPLKTVEDVTVEDILKHHKAHVKIQSNEDKIRDWYSIEMQELPHDIARLICQRSNCSWDKGLRTKFLWIIGGLFGIVVAGLVVLGIIMDETWTDMLFIIGAIFPFFTFCVKAYFENQDSIIRLKGLLSYADKIWKEVLDNKSVNGLAESSRSLQNEIFSNRSRNALIPDVFYFKHREKDEELMSRTVAQLSEQYKNKLD